MLDLQCAWQIMVQCAGPRCHFVRTVPPSESGAYAEGHDTGMMETMRFLLGETRVDGPPRRCTTSAGAVFRTWRVAARLAVPQIFLRTPLPGELAQSSAADQAHLRSHSGPWASSVLLGCPSGCEFQMFRVMTLERLRLPLQVTDAPHTGRLKRRAMAPERTLARVCGEAGGLVRFNVKLRDMNVAVPADDDRASKFWRRTSDAARGSAGNRHHFAQRHFRQRVTTAKRCAHRRSPGRTRRPSMRIWWVETGASWSWLRWRREHDSVAKLSSSST